MKTYYHAYDLRAQSYIGSGERTEVIKKLIQYLRKRNAVTWDYPVSSGIFGEEKEEEVRANARRASLLRAYHSIGFQFFNSPRYWQANNRADPSLYHRINHACKSDAHLWIFLRLFGGASYRILSSNKEIPDVLPIISSTIKSNSPL